MPTPRQRLLLMGNNLYSKRVLQTQPIAYWPMSDPSGLVCRSVVGGFNGVYYGVALGQPSIKGDGSSAYFDGSASYSHIYSAGLASAMSWTELSVMLWLKVPAAVWTDGTNRVAIILYGGDNNNRVYIRRETTNNEMRLVYAAGGTYKQVVASGLSSTDPMCLILTVSKTADTVIGYVNGVKQGATLTGLGTFVGTLTTAGSCLGALNTSPAMVFSGWIQHAALWNKSLSQAQVTELSR